MPQLGCAGPAGRLLLPQNRLWVSNKSYFECYDQEPTLISRHRLAGNVRSFHFTENGDICAVTFKDRRYLLRIYRFS
ncbi:MAG: hypothetical protein HFF19_00600 [Oscillospiraceae bacterium]|nr:hypothetical protein [Oscillospiraceae bacterium]